MASTEDDIRNAAILAERFANLKKAVDDLGTASSLLSREFVEKLSVVTNLDRIVHDMRNSIGDIQHHVDTLEDDFNRARLDTERRITTIETNWKTYAAIFTTIGGLVGAIIASKF